MYREHACPIHALVTTFQFIHVRSFSFDFSNSIHTSVKVQFHTCEDHNFNLTTHTTTIPLIQFLIVVIQHMRIELCESSKNVSIHLHVHFISDLPFSRFVSRKSLWLYLEIPLPFKRSYFLLQVGVCFLTAPSSTATLLRLHSSH